VQQPNQPGLTPRRTATDQFAWRTPHAVRSPGSQIHASPAGNPVSTGNHTGARDRRALDDHKLGTCPELRHYLRTGGRRAGSLPSSRSPWPGAIYVIAGTARRTPASAPPGDRSGGAHAHYSAETGLQVLSPNPRRNQERHTKDAATAHGIRGACYGTRMRIQPSDDDRASPSSLRDRAKSHRSARSP
jgi:hypothetical protein